MKPDYERCQRLIRRIRRAREWDVPAAAAPIVYDARRRAELERAARTVGYARQCVFARWNLANELTARAASAAGHALLLFPPDGPAPVKLTRRWAAERMAGALRITGETVSALLDIETRSGRDAFLDGLRNVRDGLPVEGRWQPSGLRAERLRLLAERLQGAPDLPALHPYGERIVPLGWTSGWREVASKGYLAYHPLYRFAVVGDPRWRRTYCCADLSGWIMALDPVFGETEEALSDRSARWLGMHKDDARELLRAEESNPFAASPDNMERLVTREVALAALRYVLAGRNPRLAWKAALADGQWERMHAKQERRRWKEEGIAPGAPSVGPPLPVPLEDMPKRPRRERKAATWG